MAHLCDPIYLLGRSQKPAKAKSLQYSILTDKLGMVQTCNSSYMGERGRRFVVQGRLGIKALSEK
jgi:hypothetical protein